MTRVTSIDVGTRHLAYCIVDSEREQILDWDNIDLGPFPTIGLIEKLTKLPQLWEVDDILVETCHSVNPMIKSFSKEIKMFLTIRKVDWKKNCKIHMYSSKYKTQVFGKDYVFPPEIYETVRSKKKMSKYMRTKHEALYITGELLHKQENDDMINYYLGNTKMCKRDLADSFCQAISFIRRTNAGKSIFSMRAPSKKQIKCKKYSKSNLKYILNKEFLSNNKTIEDFEKEWLIPIQKQYGVYYDRVQMLRELNID
jgi:hypothetical protein